MITRICTQLALATVLGLSGAAHAALQGRDLDGNLATAEAYYDTVLNITWLADANYAKTSGYNANGSMTFVTANTWAANLSFTDGVNNITYNNWRLPSVNPVNGVSFNYNYHYNGGTDDGFNISKAGTAYAGSTGSEMAYMFYVTLGNPGYYTPAGAVSGCYVSSSNTCLDNVSPFINLQQNVYWSATEYAPNPTTAWSFHMGMGYQLAYDKVNPNYAWAVSSGDVGIAAVPEPDTWAMLLAGLGLVGVATRRRKPAKV
jgi:hypothetical protein